MDARTLEAKAHIAERTTKNQEQAIKEVYEALDKVKKQHSAERDKLEVCSRTGRLP